MDWVRAVYYLLYYHTGLADTYRNEQYFPKADVFYNFERDMITLNFANPDKAKTARNLIVHLNFRLKCLIEALEGDE